MIRFFSIRIQLLWRNADSALLLIVALAVGLRLLLRFAFVPVSDALPALSAPWVVAYAAACSIHLLMQYLRAFVFITQQGESK